MKCEGWKCSFSFVVVLGAILLAVVPFCAQKVPASSATPSKTGTSPGTPGVPLKIVDLLNGIRAPEEQEIEGLDITQHGDEANSLES
jgi:hypothetical protein